MATGTAEQGQAQAQAFTFEPFEPPTGDGRDPPVLSRLSDLFGAARADAEEAYAARVAGVPRGPITGLPALDTALGGYLSPGVHVLHAEPGIGKSAFALQVAASCGGPALFVTCEMRALELLHRQTARATSTFLGKLKNGFQTPDQVAALVQQGAAAAPDLAIADATINPASPAWIDHAAEIVRGDAAHILIVIDSLHTWAEGAAALKGGSEYDTLTAAMMALRTLAARLRAPILVIAERNRASMSSGGMSAGAGNRKIEYSAETVIGLGKTDGDEATPDASGRMAITATIHKNRNGEQGRRLALTFHGALQTFAGGS